MLLENEAVGISVGQTLLMMLYFRFGEIPNAGLSWYNGTLPCEGFVCRHIQPLAFQGRMEYGWHLHRKWHAHTFADKQMMYCTFLFHVRVQSADKRRHTKNSFLGKPAEGNRFKLRRFMLWLHLFKAFEVSWPKLVLMS